MTRPAVAMAILSSVKLYQTTQASASGSKGDGPTAPQRSNVLETRVQLGVRVLRDRATRGRSIVALLVLKSEDVKQDSWGFSLTWSAASGAALGGEPCDQKSFSIFQTNVCHRFCHI